MKQVIPFIKDIEMDSNVSNVISISLEHEYNKNNDDISGNFILYGEYKVHNDTTEIKEFREVIPFSLMIPDNIIYDTLTVDIDDFTYEIKDDTKIKVCIDLVLDGEEIKVRDKDDARELESIWGVERLNDVNIDINTNVGDTFNELKIDNSIDNEIELISDNEVVTMEDSKEEVSANLEEVGEYIIYHVHIVKESETIETIMALYDSNIDIIKEYNDVSNLVVGSKLVIPEVYYGKN